MRRCSRCSMTVMRSGCSGSRGGAQRSPPASVQERVCACVVAGDRSNKLNSALRSGYAERRARTRLAMRPVEVTDDDVARIDALAEVSVIVELLQDLPTDQRTAVLARIVDEGEYADIAVTQGVSEAVVRQRVSRGLAGLRRQWEKRI